MRYYLDTSALVALFVSEARSAAVLTWLQHSTDSLLSSIWCVTEFASALGIKQRTLQLSATEASAIWSRFDRFSRRDLRLVQPKTHQYSRAARLALDAASGLRSGDAMHLTIALESKADKLLTLDQLMAKNALRLHIPLAII